MKKAAYIRDFNMQVDIYQHDAFLDTVYIHVPAGYTRADVEKQVIEKMPQLAGQNFKNFCHTPNYVKNRTILNY